MNFRCSGSRAFIGKRRVVRPALFDYRLGDTFHSWPGVLKISRRRRSRLGVIFREEVSGADVQDCAADSELDGESPKAAIKAWFSDSESPIRWKKETAGSSDWMVRPHME